MILSIELQIKEDLNLFEVKKIRDFSKKEVY